MEYPCCEHCTPPDCVTAPHFEDCPACLRDELAACRLALLNARTEKDAAQAEAAELRDARAVAMADALGVTTTPIAMLP